MLLDLPTDSQEAVQVVWHCQLFKNFPQFVVIHTVKGFGVVSKAEVDVFLELLCFFDDLTDVHSRLLSCQDENGIFLVAFFLTTYALYFHFLFLV